MKIGVITDSFKKASLKEALEEAHSLGLSGVQIYATTGSFSPEVLSCSAKEEIKKALRDNHLEVSALCGDMGGYGFQIEKDNAERIEKTKKIVDLAKEFSSSVVTTHIGVIPKDKSNPRYGVMLRALTACGIYAQSQGVTLAIETGPEKPETLLGFLKDTKGGVGVNLDPANFAMVTGVDPVQAVYELKDYIVHTHAKDGVRLIPTDPEIIYEGFAKGGVDALNSCKSFLETPIGKGSVDFPRYLAALKEIGYHGYLTIERETGKEPAKDIALAVGYLEKIGKPLGIF